MHSTGIFIVKKKVFFAEDRGIIDNAFRFFLMIHSLVVSKIISSINISVHYIIELYIISSFLHSTSKPCRFIVLFSFRMYKYHTFSQIKRDNL